MPYEVPLFKKGVLDILRSIYTGRKRFQDLEEVGLSPSTLAERVKVLEQLELIRRVPDTQRRPMVVYYEMTGKGLEFYNFLTRQKLI